MKLKPEFSRYVFSPVGLYVAEPWRIFEHRTIFYMNNNHHFFFQRIMNKEGLSHYET